MKSIAGAISLIILTGCSSVVNDTTHPMKIESRDANGEIVKGAKCNLSNDYGKVDFLSGDTVNVRRSSKDLEICCGHPSKPDANGRAISRANGLTPLHSL